MAGRKGWAVALVAAAAVGCGDVRLRSPLLAISVSSESIDYGLVALGGEARRKLTVRNTGRAPLTIATLAAPAPFVVLGFPADGVPLQSGEERAFEIAFAPRVEGRFNAALHVESDEGPRDVALTGEGLLAFAAVGQKELDFGQVLLGSSRMLELEVRNDTALSTSVRVQLRGMDATEFSAASASQSSVRLAAGERKLLPVAFRPDHLGTGEAELVVSPCASCGDVVVALTGEGVASCIGVTPSQVDFGTVELGSTASQAVELSNVGTTPIDVTDVFLAASSSDDFAVNGFTGGSSPLAVGGTMSVTVGFKPSSKGEKKGALRIKAGAGADPCWAEVRVRGVAGAGCLEVTPLAIDFGTVAAGMSTRRELLVANTACGDDVWLESAQASGDAEFSAAPLQGAPLLLRQGDIARIAVTFSPGAPGSYSGQVVLQASDSSRRPLADPPAPVPLTGASRTLAPCDFSMVPPRMDFGTVNVGARANLAFKLTNLGKDACYFSGLALTTNSSPAFRLIGGTPGVQLNAGESYDLRVRFAPDAEGSFAGALEGYVSNPADPYRTWPIFGRAVQGCLSIAPNDIDFGNVLVGCPSPTRTSVITNQCPGDVTLQSLLRGPGTSNEFGLPNLPAFPQLLRQGQSLSVDISYTPVDKGLDSMPLFVNDGAADHLISVRGVGRTDPHRTDRFDQPLQDKVDVLFVLDNSGSMADEQAAVGANLASFLQYAISQGIDYHVAATTTGMTPSTGGWTACPGGADGGEAGRFYPVDGSSPRIITPGTPNASQVWAYNTNVGLCHWLEEGFEAAVAALSPPLVDHADDTRTAPANDGNLGFMRPDAKLAVVFVSDEEDQSPQPVDYYATFFQSLKPDPALLSLSAIVTPADAASCPSGTSSGNRYIEIANRTGGVVESICTTDWSGSLKRLGNSAFGGSASFPLSSTPRDPSQIVVEVDGQPVTDGWTYDPATNRVIFDGASIPPPGAHVEIKYEMACVP